MDESFVGCKISLISKSEIRYEGILHDINSMESTVTLENVRSFGSEGRRKGINEIKPSPAIYEMIVFKSSDIFDLKVCEAPRIPYQDFSLGSNFENYYSSQDSTTHKPVNNQSFFSNNNNNSLSSNSKTTKNEFESREYQNSSSLHSQDFDEFHFMEPEHFESFSSSNNVPHSSIDQTNNYSFISSFHQPFQQQPLQPRHYPHPSYSFFQTPATFAPSKSFYSNFYNPTSTFPKENTKNTNINDENQNIIDDIEISSMEHEMKFLTTEDPQFSQKKQVEIPPDSFSTFPKSSDKPKLNFSPNQKKINTTNRNSNFQSQRKNYSNINVKDFNQQKFSKNFDFDSEEIRASKEEVIFKEFLSSSSNPTSKDSNSNSQFYSKKSSFFDNISCEAKELQDKGKQLLAEERKSKFKQERNQNIQTFGTTGHRNNSRNSSSWNYRNGGGGGHGKNRSFRKENHNLQQPPATTATNSN